MRYAMLFLTLFASSASADNFVVCSPSRIEVAAGHVVGWEDGDTYLRLTDDGDLVDFHSSLCAIETVPPMLSDNKILIGCQDHVGNYSWMINIDRVTGEYTKMAATDPTGAIFTIIGRCELQTSTKF